METYGAFDAKTHLSKLLDKVEHGATILITKNGRPVAKLVPANREDEKTVTGAIRKLREIRNSSQPGPSIRELIDEGRKD